MPDPVQDLLEVSAPGASRLPDHPEQAEHPDDREHDVRKPHAQPRRDQTPVGQTLSPCQRYIIDTEHRQPAADENASSRPAKSECHTEPTSHEGNVRNSAL